MVHRYSAFIKTVNLIVDYVVLNIGMVLAYYIEVHKFEIWPPSQHALPIVLVFNLTWLLSANLTRLYSEVLNKDSVNTFRNIAKTYLIFVALIAIIALVIGVKAYRITNMYLVVSSVLFGVLLCSWKLVFLGIRKSNRASLFDSRKVVIIGSGRISNDLYNFFIGNPDRGYKLMGFFDDNYYDTEANDLYLGSINECIAYSLKHNVAEIFCALPVLESKKIEKLLGEAEKNLIRFRIVPEYYDYGIKPVLVQSFGNIPVISVRTEPLENLLNRFCKRLFDICFSLFIIIFVFSWIYPILAILIKLGSKGPVLFKQLRSGRDNNPFWCYKFRSMLINSDSDSKQAVRNDKRVTRIGAFMRRTSIDELPQFFNVLIGNMSTVGPRPHMLSHTIQYSKLIDRFMVRHFLKPGITGWAQVKGLRGETLSTEMMLKRVEADVWYLENWSFLLDLKIIFLTVWNSIRGDEKAF
ncbi:undecaprenyl-phosphate glucose phosphotransferase [Mucilaginibacter terrenus]|uniref:Undecaprenyl-phosphate glucose phosphotransferase n=1 Tax=Mucilaginibacter terrenus TaxID=2482727 RepID=A0A3E2NXX6_9SPHI|nr:undecaprenyl-phosphate glucose phosphotransferase [Mucilaginibacter terrenus]RFZ85771.1 undecaprenyl-phosphate glucose phosphotransferase [Mucilaginibacter terrenus]